MIELDITEAAPTTERIYNNDQRALDRAFRHALYLWITGKNPDIHE